MFHRLLDFLRCPECGGDFELVAFKADGPEVITGLLHCRGSHYFPIFRGIPRLLPNSLSDYWPEIQVSVPDPMPTAVQKLIESGDLEKPGRTFDLPTKANFSNEWDHHELGGKTWTMELDDRVQWFFLDPINIPKDELSGKLMLDAGCGNGSQSVAYTGFGLEVVAVDLSNGLEKGQAFKEVHPTANPGNVHFVQADLQNPPFAPGTFDIIHSVGVLHHTPNTLETFRALRPLLKAGGTFYVWLYKYEKWVTPVVNSLRAITTRIPASAFAALANLMALPFIGFCWAVNKLGIRKYEPINRREAALAVHDIFGAPYAHYHDYDEVAGWYHSVGMTNVWPVNDGRRGFGVCGRHDETLKGAATSAGHR